MVCPITYGDHNYVKVTVQRSDNWNATDGPTVTPYKRKRGM